MKSTDRKAFTYSFSVFVGMLAVTFTTAFFFKFNLSAWSKRNFDELTKNISTLVDTGFNTRRVTVYGLMNISRNIYREAPILLTKLDKGIVEAFGKNEFTIFTDRGEVYTPSQDAEKKIEFFEQMKMKPNFVTHLTNAMNEDRPIYFGEVEAEEQPKLYLIIPVDKDNQAYIFTYIDYQELLNPIFKAKMLDGVTQLGLRVTQVSDDFEKVIYESEKYPTDTTIVKRKASALEDEQIVQLDHVKLKLSFVQYKASDLGLLINNITYTVLGIGSVISIIGFGISYGYLTLYHKE